MAVRFFKYYFNWRKFMNDYKIGFKFFIIYFL